ncbi:beta-lactamase-like protein [Phakopsora pachyrhizi]|uniref:Cleavage and polyadenylation specificity factor subunit 2 n=1 Tax=Phakopsora pachyrhizi TaxID=170000 RepID=A0AAV0ALQ2_PHAPC|nr:beta-lactamase-like protein [Phakopsora pachyrhizi]CAH7669574.1 beta-lactamase-like protein [Phakopsora pachyrhizi]
MAIGITPLIGAQDASRTISSLLEIEEGKILLDCGCPDRPTSGQIDGYVQTLARLAPQLDLVLLSHPLLSVLGLVPFMRSRLGLRCPIYATLPTKEMGRRGVEEWVGQRSSEESNGLKSEAELELEKLSISAGPRHSRKVETALDRSENGTVSANQDYQQFTTDQIWKVSFKEIRDSFDSVIAVRYSQPIYLGGKLRPLTLTAHRSGHTLGGTIWSLRSPLHTVSSASSSTLIYAPIFNHIRERHLESAALVQETGEGSMRIGLGMSRPMVMVVGTERSQRKGIRKKDRDRILLDAITNTLRSSNSVLIPADPSTRLIELLLILDNHWAQSRLETYPICLVSRTGKDIVTFIRSLTEWMSLSLAKPSFENNKRGGGRDQNDQGPLRFRFLRFYSSVEELDAELPPRQPKLIIAAPMSLDYGFSRVLMSRMAAIEGSLIVLTFGTTERSDTDDRFQTLADWLAKATYINDPNKSERVDGVVEDVSEAMPSPVQLNTKLNVDLRKKVLLEGEELEAYLEEERKAKERKTKAAAMLARSRQIIEDESDDSGSESESDTEEAVMARSLLNGGPGWDEFVDELEPMAFDIYVKGGSATRLGIGKAQRFRMYPLVERRRKVDGYGEVVDVDGWLRRGDAVDEAILKAESAEQANLKDKALNQAELELPSKFVSNTQEVEIKCKVLRIDLEGKADGRALKTIIPQINPKTIVLVNGSLESNEDFARSVAAISSFTKQIFSPGVGERATVGHDTKSFSVWLGNSIMSSLRFSQVDGFEVAYVSGKLQLSEESSIPTLERHVKEPPKKIHRRSITTSSRKEEHREEEHSKASLKTLEPLSTSSSTSSIFIGDLRLAELKAYLISLEIPAEFAAEGVLVCGPIKLKQTQKIMTTELIGSSDDLKLDEDERKNLVGGTVAVRKSTCGQVLIEGFFSVTFLMIKEAVYNFHARTVV